MSFPRSSPFFSFTEKFFAPKPEALGCGLIVARFNKAATAGTAKLKPFAGSPGFLFYLVAHHI